MTKPADNLLHAIQSYVAEPMLSDSEKIQHITEAALHYAEVVHGFKPELQTWQQYMEKRSKNIGRSA